MPFKKGQSGNPRGKPLGTKNRATLLKEERRAIFDYQVSQNWEQTIAKLRPEYIADQYLGKAPEEVNVNAKVVTSTLPQEVIEQAKKLLKDKLSNGETR